MFFACEGGWVGEQGFPGSMRTFSLEEYPRELKIQSISGLLVKGTGRLP